MSLAERIAAEYGLRKSGDRYTGRCPSCGGSKKSDKFVVRTDNGFSYKCYAGCGLEGDDIKWLREQEGYTCPEAHAEAGKVCENISCPVRATCRMGDGKQGKSSRRRRPARLEDRYQKNQQPATIPVHKITKPNQLWKDWAMSLVAKGAAALSKEPAILADLEKRGITPAAADRFSIGWLAHDRKVKYTDIGLSIPEGKKEQMWVPGGILIPIFDRSGQIYRIRIRRTEAARKKFLWKRKYEWIKGSGKGLPLIIRPNGEIHGVVIVEAELDAYAIAAACTSVIVVALGSVAMGLPEEIIEEFHKDKVILVAFDADEDSKTKAGQKASLRWTATFPRAKYWPVPEGKDPGEYAEQGGDLAEWITAGLPYVPSSSILPHPKNAHEHIAPPDCAMNGGRGEEKSGGEPIITLLNGKEIHLTDDQVRWRELAGEGKLVLSGGELQRLKAATDGMNEDDRLMFLDKMLEVKDVFGGAYVSRGAIIKE